MERLQKVLATAGLGSRRECETLIEQGRVTVDGKVVTEQGDKVDIETQDIRCDQEPLRIEKKRCYLFYKPQNCVCTNAPHQGERVIDYFQSVSYRLFTIGRLDKDSEGLILVTNDGDLAQKLAHPKYQISKVYRVTVRKKFTRTKLEELMQGVWLSEGKVAPDHVKIVKTSEVSSVIEVHLREGKNRVIRRMLAKIGYPVSRLIRIKFGQFEVGDLKPGQYRLLENQDWENCLKATPKPKVKRIASKSDLEKKDIKIPLKKIVESRTFPAPNTKAKRKYQKKTNRKP